MAQASQTRVRGLGFMWTLLMLVAALVTFGGVMGLLIALNAPIWLAQFLPLTVALTVLAAVRQYGLQRRAR
ncbi:MAG TPA: hypothetical protein VNK05_17440 [Chloroflexota bacterium]|nr:hypothetical protein [Chloroflexota bacterium]